MAPLWPLENLVIQYLSSKIDSMQKLEIFQASKVVQLSATKLNCCRALGKILGKNILVLHVYTLVALLLFFLGLNSPLSNRVLRHWQFSFWFFSTDCCRHWVAIEFNTFFLAPEARLSGAESKAASLLAVLLERLTILRGMLKQCLVCPHFTSNVI